MGDERLSSCLAMQRCQYRQRPYAACSQKYHTFTFGIFIKRTTRDKQYVRIALSGQDICIIDTLIFGDTLMKRSVLLLQHTDLIKETEYMYGFVFRSITSALFTCADNQMTRSYKVLCRRSLPGSTGIIYELRTGESGIVVGLQSDLSSAAISPDQDLKKENLELIIFVFDFAFNPVCFLYNAEAARRTFYGVGYQDPLGLTFHTIEKFFVKHQNKSISESWSELGECALRGNRTQGVNAYLHDLNLYIKISDGHKSCETRRWNVDIGAIKLDSGRHIPSEELKWKAKQDLEITSKINSLAQITQSLPTWEKERHLEAVERQLIEGYALRTQHFAVLEKLTKSEQELTELEDLPLPSVEQFRDQSMLLEDEIRFYGDKARELNTQRHALEAEVSEYIKEVYHICHRPSNDFEKRANEK